MKCACVVGSVWDSLVSFESRAFDPTHIHNISECLTLVLCRSFWMPLSRTLASSCASVRGGLRNGGCTSRACGLRDRPTYLWGGHSHTHTSIFIKVTHEGDTDRVRERGRKRQNAKQGEQQVSADGGWRLTWAPGSCIAHEKYSSCSRWWKG